MFFKKEDIQEVGRNVAHKTMMMNVVIVGEDRDRFNSLLDKILKEKQYSEGEKINDKHMTAIKSNINIIIGNLSDHLVKYAHRYKDSMELSNPVECFSTAVDSLFISAMEKLGCPNMPIVHFDPEIKKTLEESAMKVHRSVVTFDISKENTFKQQRGKDAAVVSKEFGRHVDGIKNGKKAESIGKMIAEYQALKERQKNHTAFWRFFHRTENKDRNALIEKMGKIIKGQLPAGMKGINLDEAVPNLVSRNIADALIRGEVEMAGPKRFDPKTAAQVFGCSPANEEIEYQRKLFDELSNKEQMSKDVNFLNDVIGADNANKNNVSKDDEIKNDKVVVKEGNEFSLFN